MRSTFTEHDFDPTNHNRVQPPPRAAGPFDPDPIGALDPTTVRAATQHIAAEQPPPPVTPAGADAPAEEDAEKKKSGLLDLKPSQLAGGALASCTAAVLGGHLGVAGTVGGAALTSVTVAVASAAYTHSIDKTRSGLGSVRQRFRLGGAPTADTAVLPVPAAPGEAAERKETAPPWYSRVRPVRVLAAAATVFLLGAVVLTGFEALKGGSVSGGAGTTAGQIARGDVSTSRTGDSGPKGVKEQAPAEGQKSAQPAPSNSAQPTAQPSTSATPAAAKSAGATASKAPTTGSRSGSTTGAGGSSGADSTTSGSRGSGTDDAGSGNSGTRSSE